MVWGPLGPGPVPKRWIEAQPARQCGKTAALAFQYTKEEEKSMTTEAQKTADKIGYHFDLAANSVRCANSAGDSTGIAYYTAEAQRHRTMGVAAFLDYANAQSIVGPWPLKVVCPGPNTYTFENLASLTSCIQSFRDRNADLERRLRNSTAVAEDRLKGIEDLSKKLADAEERLTFVRTVVDPQTELVRE